MRRLFALSVVAGLLAMCWPNAPAVAQIYDIRAEFAYHPPSKVYVVQIRNVGPVIVGTIRAEFYLSFPSAINVVNWTLNGWQCLPGLPAVGPVAFHCSISLSAAWAAGTILSNQLFFVTAPSRRQRVCVRSLVFINNALTNEINVANNSKCI